MKTKGGIECRYRGGWKRMDARQNEEFTAHLRAAVRQAEALKYNPTRFKGMIEANGGYETVKRILASGTPSDGFQKLWELGRLDLTCEAIIVESKWRPYFDDDLIERAERLLRGSNYDFKRFSPAENGRANRPVLSSVEPDERDEGAVGEDGSDAGEGDTTSSTGINAFFRDVLHAPFVNSRWSWGAVDERTRRVFLRLWSMDIAVRGGRRWIRVLLLNASTRLGWKERQRHLDLVRSGYAAFAVVCEKESTDARTILGFDRERVLRLGGVVEHEGSLWMEIVDHISLDALWLVDTSGVALSEDIRDIERAEVAATTRTALVDARLGQGRFRRELMRRWGHACAVTGCRLAAVLRASHCKPWRKSDNRERLDSHNGLILSANLDALFDAGLIGFDDDGGMIVADVVSAPEREALAIPANLTRKPSPRLKEYLRFHRENVFQG
ncbi:HNH endonuclease [Luteimonas viscosa]|nr:HNH endonuclease [Luteimonas viscosa]